MPRPQRYASRPGSRDESHVKNNDTLRRLRHALDLSDHDMLRLFAAGGRELQQSELRTLLVKPGGASFSACGDGQLGAFLDGLIADLRGAREGAPPPPDYDAEGLGNNAVLKKLRIAMEFHEADMLETFLAGEQALSVHELNALFRKPGNKHFRPCSDALLRSFLKGLAVRLRD